jgi:hypothetical protein
MELLFEFLVTERKLQPKTVAQKMWRDYRRGGRYDKPPFLKEFLTLEEPIMLGRKAKPGLPRRQARRLV